MPLFAVPASDELPHAVGSEIGWSESYSFQLVDPREGIALLTATGVPLRAERQWEPMGDEQADYQMYLYEGDYE